MKKPLLLLLALVFGFGLKAQCPLTQAVDFTATDCHGTEVHLFDILDSGQYVLIDFFFTTCGPCQQATPKIRDSYTAFGCNLYDVFYMEISDRDSEASCINWVNNYGIEYPTISGAAGGNIISNQYGISAFPTVILIAPDRSILINDLWPINNAQSIITQLEAHGIQQHDCSEPSYEETLTLSTDTINVEWRELTWITIYNNTSQDAVVDTVFSYFLSYTLDGTTWFSTLRPREFTIPQGESIELGLYCDAVAKDTVITDVVTLAGNFPDADFVAMVHLPWNFPTWSVEENTTSLTLYPNPANERLTLKGESRGFISVYNALGQKVDEFYKEGNELNINTANYENGNYIIKTAEKALRFMVNH